MTGSYTAGQRDCGLLEKHLRLEQSSFLASLTKYRADEVGSSPGCGAEGIEVQPRALTNWTKHRRWCVGRALKQALQEVVHQEHRRAQAALVAPSRAWLPKGRGCRRGKQGLGLGPLLPLSVLAGLLAVSLFPIFFLSLKKRGQNHRCHLRPPVVPTQSSACSGMGKWGLLLGQREGRFVCLPWPYPEFSTGG